MKRLLAVLAAAALLGGGAAWAEVVTRTLQVKGWTCKACCTKTENALGKLDGVQKVKTDLAAKEVEVTFDDAKVSEADLKAAIKKAGGSCPLGPRKKKPGKGA